MQNGFVLDDRSLVERNLQIRDLRRIPALFTLDYWYPKTVSGLYRPIVTTSYALNYAVGRGDPTTYHAVNVAIHGLVSVLVLALFRRLAAPGVALAGALLFAAHAVHSEAVANVAGRAELLAALLFLGALLFYLRCREAAGPRRAGRYAASLGLYLLALLCKESAATLVAVIALHDFLFGEARARRWWARASETLARHWRAYTGYVLVTGLYLALRILALGWKRSLPPELHFDNPLVTLDVAGRLLSALEVGLRYLGLLFFPLRLSYDYSYDQIPLLQSLADPRAWAVLAAWAVLVGLALWSYRLSRPLFFGIGFYLLTFFPVSNLVIAIGTIMGERLLYVPSIGFCLALAEGLRRLCDRLPSPPAGRALFATLLVLALGFHGLRTVVRNLDWRNQESLYLHDVSLVPNSAKALNNAGAMFFGNDQNEEALELLEKAIAIAPQSTGYLYRTAGFAYSALGRNREALAMYEEALRYGSTDPKVFNNLGFILVDLEIDVKRGVAFLEKAVQRVPDEPDFRDSLGWGYYKQGRLDAARQELRRSLELDATSPSAPSRRAHLEEIEAELARRGPRDASPSGD